uniref:beta-1,4-galactosyltransferase 1-like isoform X2 n=1 Tax=Myxine glutinosa TaxID=7769 RepID=UPI00358E6FEC
MLWVRCLKLLAAFCALCAGFFLVVVFLISETWVFPSLRPGDSRTEKTSFFWNRMNSPANGTSDSLRMHTWQVGGDEIRVDGEVINSSVVLQLELCPEQPEGLVGPLHIDFSAAVTIDQVAASNSMIKLGGRYGPSDCEARQKIAIVIPFRNREKHLVYWLYYLHPILIRQQGDYAIYVVHQAGNGTFNRAKLLNIGAVEALKDQDYDCLVFSDVDIIPMDDRNLYHCGKQPRHLACAMDKFGFRLPYHGYFGGVIGLTRQQFYTINGFSNHYWGWGTEDDDMYKRITLKGMKVERPPAIIARTKMIHHHRDKGNGVNTKNL